MKKILALFLDWVFCIKRHLLNWFMYIKRHRIIFITGAVIVVIIIVSFCLSPKSRLSGTWENGTDLITQIKISRFLNNLEKKSLMYFPEEQSYIMLESTKFKYKIGREDTLNFGQQEFIYKITKEKYKMKLELTRLYNGKRMDPETYYKLRPFGKFRKNFSKIFVI